VTLLGLALRNLSGSGFRSVVIGFCVLVVSAFSLSTTLIIRGAESSLDLGIQRLGADVVVVSMGAAAKVETALLMGKPTTSWMPEANYQKIAAMPGVASASPQTYLGSLNDASCCAVSELFMIALDPKSDFTVQPWLDAYLGRGLSLGESIGGSYVYVPDGESHIRLYGYPLALKGNLEPTGTGLDQTLFLNLDTVREMARLSVSDAEKPLQIPDDRVSAVMVKAAPGIEVGSLARRVMREVPGVSAIESPDMFQSARKQMASLVRSFVVLLGIIWVVSLALVGFAFSITTNARRREVGVLRALGCTSEVALRSLLVEGAILALGGGLLGTVLAGAAVYLFSGLIVSSLGIPFLFPPVLELLGLVGAGLALALVTVALAATVPALRVSRQDPAVAMRE
jgi:putative ABC transport system permease protein